MRLPRIGLLPRAADRSLGALREGPLQTERASLPAVTPTAGIPLAQRVWEERVLALAEQRRLVGREATLAVRRLELRARHARDGASARASAPSG